MRQAIHKQNNRPTIPDTFIINGKSNSNMSEIAEEFNNFFVNIGEQTAKNLPQPTNSFSDYLNGNYAANLFMFPTCEAEILHTTTNLKASTSEGYDNISTSGYSTGSHCKPITISWHIPKRHETCQNCSYF